MKATLELDPSKYSDLAIKLILKKAREWGITPAEAVARLLDELAQRNRDQSADEPSIINISRAQQIPKEPTSKVIATVYSQGT
jgi:arginyl-tRNA synthetase